MTRVRYFDDVKTCATCDGSWVVGDELTRQKHRKRCAPHLAVLEAAPLEHMRSYAGRFFEVSAEISESPPRWAQVHVQHCARLLSRELAAGVSSEFWHPDYRSHESALAFIPVSDDCRMQGVAVVTNPNSETPVLSWTWIVPKMRKQGVFTKTWNMLSERYGNFKIGGPYSAEMWGYLQCRNIATERLVYVQDIMDPGPVRFVGNRAVLRAGVDEV